MAEDGAIDAHQPLAVALEIGADKLARGPLQDAEDFAGSELIRAIRFAGQMHQHRIAGGGVERMILFNANLGAGLALDQMRADETKSAAGAAIGASDGAVRRLGLDRVILAHVNAAIAVQTAQGAAEVSVLRRADAELAPALWA